MSQQTYALSLVYNVGGQFAQNVLHYNFEDSGFNSTFAAADALISKWESTIRTAWMSNLPSETRLMSVKAKRVSAVGGFEAIHVQAGSVVGARTGPLIVAAVGPVLVYYEINNGHRRGRTFLPGVTSSDSSHGILSNAYVTHVEGNLATIIGNLTLTGGGAPTAKLCIYHAANHSMVLVGAANLSMTIGTQRRRQVPV